MDEHTVVELTGTIVFKMADAGSKSESIKPYLYQNKNSWVPVFREGDNPFENKGFDEFDGKLVVITGYEKKNKIFVVQKIEEKK